MGYEGYSEGYNTDVSQSVTKAISGREDDLLYLAFIKNGMPIFEMDFHVEGMKYDPTLLAGFISAVSIWSKELSAKGLEKIDQGNLKVGFLEGNHVSFFYLAGSISDELETKLHILLAHFEVKYNQFLEDDFISDPSLFSDFKHYALKLLADTTIKSHYTPVMKVPLDKAMNMYTDQTALLMLIDGRSTVGEITSNTNKSLSSVTEILAMMKLEGIIDFEINVNETDVFNLTLKGYKKVFGHTEERTTFAQLFGKQVFEIIKNIDGTKSVIEIAEDNEISRGDLQTIFSILLAKEFIKPVHERIKTLLVIDYIINKLHKTISLKLSKKSAYDLIKSTMETSNNMFTNMVGYKDRFTFDLLYSYLQQDDEIEPFHIYEGFMDPLLNIFDLYANVDNKDLRSIIFSEVNKKYGVIF